MINRRHPSGDCRRHPHGDDRGHQHALTATNKLIRTGISSWLRDCSVRMAHLQWDRSLSSAERWSPSFVRSILLYRQRALRDRIPTDTACPERPRLKQGLSFAPWTMTVLHLVIPSLINGRF